MYSELIYTRCGVGVDILKKRSLIKTSGFKVYSCSGKLTDDNIVDLPFLNDTAQSKEPYEDPNFMDDAYLFYVPDVGEKYFLNFHPIHFDMTATDSHSHRPGNFINQVFIGKFDDLYPYELFGDKSVWDAKKRGELFYYENLPVDLPEREDLGKKAGYIRLEDIVAFVKDGRRDVLMKAIAFVVSQYYLPPEDRKFLVIKDENSRKIELWIAAIESAFSPRMASGLPFATRLDRFTDANKYTVNLDGDYQAQANLQKPNQKLRYRAMIVGVDERDQLNSSAVRVLDNSSYVVLDGKTKSLSANVDASNDYYRVVTSYDENHLVICRKFMQMVDVYSPSYSVIKIYDSFASLEEYDKNRRPKDLLTGLSMLSQFKLIKTYYLKRLYDAIKKEVIKIIKEDVVTSFKIMDWLESTAVIVGDSTITDDFKGIVCRSYTDALFMRPQSNLTSELHDLVQNSAFAQCVAEYAFSKTALLSYKNSFVSYDAASWLSFNSLCLSLAKSYRELPETITYFLRVSMRRLCDTNDVDTASEIVSLYVDRNKDQTLSVLLEDVGDLSNDTYGHFIIKVICKSIPEIVSSQENLSRFYECLQKFNVCKYYSDALVCAADQISEIQDIDKFIDFVTLNKNIEDMDLGHMFNILDKKLVISDESAVNAACSIQRYKPNNMSCINSAHIYAMCSLCDKRMSDNIVQILNNVVMQGFPCVNDEEYADRIVDKIFDKKLPEEVFRIIAYSAINSDFYCSKIVFRAVNYVDKKQYSFVEYLIDIAKDANSQILFKNLVDCVSRFKNFDKKVSSIEGAIRSRSGREYFKDVVQNAKRLHEPNEKKSLFGRFFA